MSLLVTKTLNKIVDVAKSEIVPVVKLGNLNAPTNILCCKIGSLPMTYLGKPFGAPFQAISIWDPIIEKMERKLSLWKHLYSSKGGRLTLLKSTLSSLPTYYLSLFIVPKSVADGLEKIQKNFLLGLTEEEFKYLLVAWGNVCSPIEIGCLGIWRIGNFNQALLGSGYGASDMKQPFLA